MLLNSTSRPINSCPATSGYWERPSFVVDHRRLRVTDPAIIHGCSGCLSLCISLVSLSDCSESRVCRISISLFWRGDFAARCVGTILNEGATHSAILSTGATMMATQPQHTGDAGVTLIKYFEGRTAVEVSRCCRQADHWLWPFDPVEREFPASHYRS